MTLPVSDQGDPYTYVQIRGRVTEIEDGETARAHIDALSQKYTGHKYRGGTPGEVRLKLYVEPDRVILAGG